MKEHQARLATSEMHHALIRLQGSISDGNWTKHALATNRAGDPVDIVDATAVRFCVYGALLRELWPALDIDMLKRANLLMHRSAAELSGKPGLTVFAFNDDRATDIADIQSLLQVATTVLKSESWTLPISTAFGNLAEFAPNRQPLASGHRLHDAGSGSDRCDDKLPTHPDAMRPGQSHPVTAKELEKPA